MRTVNQQSESLPGVAIRRGCSAGDEYGYRARWAIKRGVVTNTPIACKPVRIRPSSTNRCYPPNPYYCTKCNNATEEGAIMPPTDNEIEAQEKP